VPPLTEGRAGPVRGQRRARFGRIAAAILAISLALAGPVAAQEAKRPSDEVSLNLSQGQALQIARRALDLDRPDLAADIAQQFLQQAPENAEAILILAAAQSRLGNAAAAEAAGRQAYRLGAGGDARFEAAFLTASALAAQNQPQRAKYWLRRADTHAQTPSDTQLLRRAFVNMDRRTPYRLTFQLNGGPSDNVNGGSLHDTFWLDGIFPIPIAQALPGFAVQGQAKLSYRILEDATRSLSVFGTLSGRKVWLNDQARVLDRAARASDFGSVGLDLGVLYQTRLTDRLGLAVEGQIGHRKLGTGTARNSQRLRFSLDQALSRNRVLSLDLITTAFQTPDGSSRDSLSVTAEAGLWMPVGRGAVTARLGYDTVMTDARGVAWRGPSLGVDVQLPPVAGAVDLALFGTVQMKDYWKTTIAPDQSLEIGASAKFRNLSVMGFAPTVSLSTSRNRSDIVVRDSANTSLSLGLSSTF
jgi:hypothetical protein